MENLNNGLTRQGLLFDDLKESSLFYITSQRNLMSFLGAGMLLPAGSQFRYKEDTREFFGGAIPFWKGGLPSSSQYEEMIKNDRVVIVECHTDDVMRYGSRFVVTNNDSLIVVNAPIPLRSVSAFYLSSNEVITDFLMRLPEDVIADRSVFKVLPNFKSLEHEASANTENHDDISQWLSFIDSFGGGVKALEKFASEKTTDHSYILDLLPLCFEAYNASNIDSVVTDTAEYKSKFSIADRVIFLELLPILQEIKPEEGFDQIYILEKLEKRLNASEAGSLEEVIKWLAYVKKVVDAEIKVPVLADEGEVFKRGVLLFLLRPDLDRLSASVNSSISPGPVVLSIAALLAGYATGLTRMGSEYKGDYRSFNRFSKSLLDSLWCKSGFSFTVVRELTTNYGASHVYELNNEVLFKLKIRQNIVLARVLNQAKAAGYNLQYDYEKHELFYHFTFDGDRSQTVYIELINPLAPGFNVIRFVSPCLDLSGRKSRSLKKDIAIDFLKRNSEDSMYCAFAYSEKRKAIVVEAMQIVRTMDDDEFITLLKYVAKVADEYERDVLGKDEY